MRLFATEFAQRRLNALHGASIHAMSIHTWQLAARRGVDMRPGGTEREPTAEELELYSAASRAVAAEHQKLEAYIASLEEGARCAFDVLVNEAKSWIASGSPRRARECAARAREIAQAFKGEGIAA